MREISESESPGHVTAQTRPGLDTGGASAALGKGVGERGRVKGRRKGEGKGRKRKGEGGREGAMREKTKARWKAR